MDTTERCVDGLTFTEWYRQVDRACAARYGVGIDDLADGPSWDSWDAGMTPVEYVTEVMPDIDDLLGMFIEDLL